MPYSASPGGEVLWGILRPAPFLEKRERERDRERERQREREREREREIDR